MRPSAPANRKRITIWSINFDKRSSRRMHWQWFRLHISAEDDCSNFTNEYKDLQPSHSHKKTMVTHRQEQILTATRLAHKYALCVMQYIQTVSCYNDWLFDFCCRNWSKWANWKFEMNSAKYPSNVSVLKCVYNKKWWKKSKLSC